MHDDKVLWEYLDGELPADTAAALSGEIESDPELARRVAELRLVKAEVLAGAPRAAPGFAERVVAAAKDRPQAPVIDLADARRMLRRALVAAAVLAALSLVYLGVRVIPAFLEPAQAGGLLP
ncbi:MAG: hypothetical protein OER88_12040 [Planctomycetota bacterium]|nr:hypothetical protein [Planctomycetota bacterium]